MILLILLLGLGVGVLVGLLGIGGGIVMVPAMVYLLHMDEHLAQGTSLLILLPPVGLGALLGYWKEKQLDVRTGILCALGILIGAYAGSLIAIPMSSQHLKGTFGCFLVLAAVLLWRKQAPENGPSEAPSRETGGVVRSSRWDLGIFFSACVCGIASGLFGIGGGVLLVPFLVLLFAFGQHRAQGTSLVALIPPTGLLAFLAYNKAGYVSWKTGLLLIPGVFVGGILGAAIAKKLPPQRMRQVFAGVLFALGAWQTLSAWGHF